MKWLLLTLALAAVAAEFPPTCQKPVYCNSKLLHYVQMSRIFPDSKAFVDLQMKADEKTILTAFEAMLNKTNLQPTRDQIQEFVDHFFVEFDELENWTPTDFQTSPSFISKIKDKKLQQFGRDVIAMWPTLGRKVKTAVFKSPELFSFIPVENGFIIPGGKSKELYYWDTYWIVEGLLVSGMKDTVKGIISNLINLERKFGYVPSGSRWYFQERSQPPLLSAMMALYVEATNDVEFLKANIDALESELEYWLDTQSVVFSVDQHEYTLLRYFTPSQGPRPESYYEDFVNAQVFQTEEAKSQFFVELKSAAESGWDFSSRWFVTKDGENKGNITNTHTSEIIPVDLNAIFVNAMQKLAYFHVLLQNPRKGVHWSLLANHWANAINEVMWNDVDGIWYDFDLSSGSQRKHIYPSNVSPLWMGVVSKEFTRENADKIVHYLKKSQSLQFAGGVPASLVHTGEQWDFPNAWPPLVSMMINALESLQTKESTDLAFQVAQTWVRACYKGYISSKQLYEKYDVERPGKAGLGYDYTIQPGYGWTNGAVLQLLSKYGDALTSQDASFGAATFEAVPLPTYLNTPLVNVPYNYEVFVKSVQPDQPIQLIQSVQPVPPIQLIAPVPPTQPLHPVESVKPISPVQLIPPVPSTQQLQSFQTEQTVKPVQPIQLIAPVPPTQQFHSNQPDQTVKPVQPVQVIAPVPPTHQFQSVQTDQTVKPVQPVQLIAPVPPTQQLYTDQPNQTVKPVKPVQVIAPVPPTQLLQSFQTEQTVKPVQPVQLITSVPPTEQLNSAQPDQTVKPVQPVQLIASVPPTQQFYSNQPDQTVKPVQPVQVIGSVPPTQQLYSDQTVKPVQPVQLIAPVPPTQLLQSFQTEQTVKLVQPIQLIAPVPPTQQFYSAQPDQTVKPVKPVQVIASVPPTQQPNSAQPARPIAPVQAIQALLG